MVVQSAEISPVSTFMSFQYVFKSMLEYSSQVICTNYTVIQPHLLFFNYIHVLYIFFSVYILLYALFKFITNHRSDGHTVHDIFACCVY